ncbi:MAG: helix-turn-helix domain-containing protein [Rhodospirillales bacterium]|nr:MAG: helix-turn-helix domain-containing protein [Rhodospirillales bacterium]
MAPKMIPLVRYAMAKPFVAALEAAGGDAEATLARFGLSYKALADEEVFVSAQSWYSFVNHAAEAIGHPYFGYRLGTETAFGAWPNLRALTFEQATLAELFGYLIADARRHTTGADYNLTFDDRWAVFRQRRTFLPSPPPAQIDAFGVGFLSRVIRTAIGRHWDPSEMTITVCAPDAIPRNAFPPGAILRGGVRGGTWRFPAQWLFLGVDAAAACTGDLPDTELAAALRRILAPHLADADLTITRVAAICGHSVRSLQLGLAAAGTSFSAELEELRRTRAVALLARPDLSISEVGEAVGYPDVSSFSRAFKRWTGASPRQFRRRERVSG